MNLDKNFGTGFSLIFVAKRVYVAKMYRVFGTDCGSKLLFNFEYHDVLGGVKNV